MNKLILLVFCHLVGDYVLQNDFIAKNKGSNWYHLFVSAKYCYVTHELRLHQNDRCKRFTLF